MLSEQWWLADVQSQKARRRPSVLASKSATIPPPVPALHLQHTLDCSRNASQELPSIRPDAGRAFPARHASRHMPFLSRTFRQPGSICWSGEAAYVADRAALLSHPDAAGFPEHSAQQETLQKKTDPGMSTSSKWAMFNGGADQSEDVVAPQHCEHGASAASDWSMGLVREQGGYDDMPVTFAV